MSLSAQASVIDGWHLRPSWVDQLDLANVLSGWLVIDPTVLEARERQNEGWLKGSSNPEKMFQNFMGRSLWYNSLIKEEAGRPANANLASRWHEEC